jgi:hypothetical protein
MRKGAESNLAGESFVQMGGKNMNDHANEEYLVAGAFIDIGFGFYFWRVQEGEPWQRSGGE